MHLQTNKFFLTCIFLCVTFSIKAQQKIDPQWGKADSLLQAHQYMASLVEYERIVFQSNDAGIKKQAIFKKAMVYKAMRSYEKTEEELNRIGIRNPNDTLFPLKAYEMAFAQYMTGNYQAALSTIETYGVMISGEHQVMPGLLTLKILCYNQLFKFDRAESTIRQLAGLSNTHDSLNYTSLLTYYEKAPHYKNPETAKHLSILPGLGQVYCGKVFEGGLSFLLNASALSFGAWEVYSGYYFTGYVVGVTLLQKFHTGGQHRAELLARQVNEKHILKFNQLIIDNLVSP